MGLVIPETFTAKEVLEALNRKEEIISARTLHRIIKQLGFQRGRGRV
jgi:hypothetical protein